MAIWAIPHFAPHFGRQAKVNFYGPENSKLQADRESSANRLIERFGLHRRYRSNSERSLSGRRTSVVSFSLNNRTVAIDIDPATPLLWAIRDHAGLTGTKYGCGAGLCGACTVHVDGAAVRSCQTQMSQVAGKKVVTIEGLSPDSAHPLQKAWVAEEVPQCGYCQSGQIMQAAALLANNSKPSCAEIVRHMDGNICRCGTYHRIIAAIERAAREG